MRAASVLLLSLCLACSGSSTSEPDPAEPAVAKPQAATPEAEGPAPAEPAAAAEPAGCTLEAGADWAACDGKQVAARGRKPNMVMQHPMVSQPEGVSPDNRNTVQGYLEIGERQVIVLTSAPFDCAGEASVRGTLRRIDMGGEAGTKGSYSGWSIEDAEVNCE